ncbi:glycosyltransferase [Acidianus infernus]|uniref:Glycosyltransferase n=1 Tax=Acidianus infernus TaxID=12915 RepID=A0A6A9QL06_ACIIN|nr:glycosyltransferase [Acidianus infernus]MUM65926.1 glycosyltransferase [Acidianus infernus]
MLISVIIIAYNRRNFLLKAVKSVANQTLDKNLYEVIVVKNFEDMTIDDIINKLGYKNIVYDTPLYGERLAIGVEESSGDILAFLEDDDEFKPEKLARVYEVFTSHKDVSYFHDTRDYLYEVDDPRIKDIVRFLEKITPHENIIIDPFDKRSKHFLLKYYGAIATTSLMATRRECIGDKLDLLKRIEISVEFFIPAFSAECGKLYHTGERLTRYRIHQKNSSIRFTSEDELRVSNTYFRYIKDLELIISNISWKNQLRDVLKMLLLNNKIALYNSPKEIKEKLGYKQNVFGAIKDLSEWLLITHDLHGYFNLLLHTGYNSIPSKRVKMFIRKLVKGHD